MKITRQGIWFHYYGDEVLYVFPWCRRQSSYKYLSASFEAGFTSLYDLRQYWIGYIDAICGEIENDKKTS